ncbi:hypothetical protein ACTFIY_001691 [Dictyostelium cf. discoideum]
MHIPVVGENPDDAVNQLAEKVENANVEDKEGEIKACVAEPHDGEVTKGNGEEEEIEIKEDSKVKEEPKVEKIETPKNTNILVLGSTGVGKSTFISSLVNYLKYESLEQAMHLASLDNVATIANKVQIVDSNNVSHNFVVGKSKYLSQEHKDGESVTVKPKRYVIDMGNNKTMTILDTPGVADTRGCKQDDLNFEVILKELSEFEELHGILILLRSTDNRIDTMYKYCINELLHHLHYSAKNNIFFCFTNTRGSMYRAGPALTLLKTHLESMVNHTDVKLETTGRVFNFENEAFNVLASKLNGANFSEEDLEVYSHSWKRSSSEATKLMNTILSTPPHRVKDTECINNTREMIRKMGTPIHFCLTSIQRFLYNIEQQNENIKKHKDDLEKLKPYVMAQLDKLVWEQLDEPAIFCNKLGCHKTSKMETPKGAKEFVGRHCSASFKNKINKSSSLYWHHTFGILGGCKDCGCSYKDHSVSDIVHVKEAIQVIDEGIKGKILSKEELTAVANRRVKENLELKEKYSQEFEILSNAFAKFAIFVAHNSLVAINHDYAEYLQLEIKNLKENPNVKDREKQLEKLNEILKAHQIELDTFETARSREKEGLSPHDINLLGEEVLSLEISGRIIKDIQSHNEKQKYASSQKVKNVKVTLNKQVESAIKWLLN